MNLYRSLQHNFLFKIISFILLYGYVFAQDNVLEQKLLPLFQIIEDKEEESSSKQRAVEEIVAMGNQVKPFIEKRLEKTSHTRYFYILEKIKPVKTWNKEEYFFRKYKEALKMMRNGKREEAKEILKAIILLEKDLSFASEIDSLLASEKNRSSLISTDAYPTASYFSFRDEWKIIIAIKNNSIDPITITFAQKRLYLKITSTEYYLNGSSRTDISTKSPKIYEKVVVDGGKWWKAEISIPPIGKKQCYRKLDVQVNVKAVTLTKLGKNYFPKIKFPVAKIKVIPRKFHVIMSNPINYFEGAAQNRYYEVLFYSSFFIPQKNEKDAITALIDHLDVVTLSPLVKSILLRFTKQNFSTIRKWKNWWRARKGLWGGK